MKSNQTTCRKTRWLAKYLKWNMHCKVLFMLLHSHGPYLYIPTLSCVFILQCGSFCVALLNLATVDYFQFSVFFIVKGKLTILLPQQQDLHHFPLTVLTIGWCYYLGEHRSHAPRRGRFMWCHQTKLSVEGHVVYVSGEVHAVVMSTKPSGPVRSWLTATLPHSSSARPLFTRAKWTKLPSSSYSSTVSSGSRLWRDSVDTSLILKLKHE